MKRTSLTVAALLLVAATATAQAPQLADPFQVKMADGSPLEVGEIGHSAPVYADFDGDKIPDLIVGEFKHGACRIYKNYGTTHNPVFKDFKFFVAGGKQAAIPPD